MSPGERKSKHLGRPQLPTGFIESLLVRDSDKEIDWDPPDNEKAVHVSSRDSETSSENSFTENNRFWGLCTLM